MDRGFDKSHIKREHPTSFTISVSYANLKFPVKRELRIM